MAGNARLNCQSRNVTASVVTSLPRDLLILKDREQHVIHTLTSRVITFLSHRITVLNQYVTEKDINALWIKFPSIVHQ